MKKLHLILLLVLLILCLTACGGGAEPHTASEAEAGLAEHFFDSGVCKVCGYEKQPFNFITEDGGQSYTLAYVGALDGKEIVIPNSYKGKPVSAIADYAFSAANGSDIEKITVGEGVKTIGDYAFFGLSELSEITLPESLSSIGNWAFFGCDRLSLVRYLSDANGWAALSFRDRFSNPLSFGCRLFFGDTEARRVEITEPSAISDNAFLGCVSIEYIVISGNVEKIGKYAFSKCQSLVSIAIDGVLEIDDNAFRECYRLKSLSLGEGITRIGIGAFQEARSLVRLRIPNSTKTISSDAFYDCVALSSVVLGEGVQRINDGAFGRCYRISEVYNLSSLNEPTENKLEALGGLFAYTWVVHTEESSSSAISEEGDFVYIKVRANSTGEIVTYLTSYSGIDTSIELPEVLEGRSYHIYSFAFAVSELEEIKVPASVSYIYSFAFYGCDALRKVEIADEAGFSVYGDLEGENEILSLDGKSQSEIAKILRYTYYDKFLIRK